MKESEIDEIVGISTERVKNILTTHLNMKNFFAIKTRVSHSKVFLAMLKRNQNDFWRQFITVDETRIHHSAPETKEQCKQ